jgi:predicted membrane protein
MTLFKELSTKFKETRNSIIFWGFTGVWRTQVFLTLFMLILGIIGDLDFELIFEQEELLFLWFAWITLIDLLFGMIFNSAWGLINIFNRWLDSL